MSNDIEFMKIAIEESKKCIDEGGRPNPKVGVVVVKDGKEIVRAYRGEVNLGEHAEFTALEKKLKEGVVAGATIYTTLEPCTTRNHPKLPCSERLIERKIGRVVIGMLDPNPQITGKGQRRLREAGIATDLFPPDLMAQVEELNREFTRYQKRQDEAPQVTPELIQQHVTRSLDDWYKSLNRIYWHQNFNREPASLFAHLVEVVGGLSALASNKRKVGVNPEGHVVKAFAWWMALCGKLGIKSIEAMLWDKFPALCPYCQSNPHDANTCTEKKASTSGPPWEVLAKLGQNGHKPGRLQEWQLMFSRIYPVQQTEEFGPSFARLAEELGELAEAVRVFRAEPGYLLSEAADVFAWLMHIQNIVDTKAGVLLANRGNALEQAFAKAYLGGCKECEKQMCTCPPILQSTIGRIAHEVPTNRGSYHEGGRFMSADYASKFFLES